MIFALGEMAVLLFVCALVLWRFSDDSYKERATPINSAFLLMSVACGCCFIFWIFE